MTDKALDEKLKQEALQKEIQGLRNQIVDRLVGEDEVKELAEGVKE